MSNLSSFVLITGNTYPVKDSIKALGGRWNAKSKGWNVPADNADEARALVEGGAPSSYGARSYRATRGNGICEDAPCCGCCGPQGDGGYYSEYEYGG